VRGQPLCWSGRQHHIDIDISYQSIKTLSVFYLANGRMSAETVCLLTASQNYSIAYAVLCGAN